MGRGLSNGWNPTLAISEKPCRAKAHPGKADSGLQGLRMEVALNSDLLTSVLALSLGIYVLKELTMGAATAHDELFQTHAPP